MQKNTHALSDRHLALPLMMVLIALGYLFIHDIAGGTLLTHDPFDSYTLQAMAWLRGETILADGQHYPWLELAVYHGDYYVSFPPVPTLPMLPMVILFGANTPNNLMVGLYAMIAIVGAYRACRAIGLDVRYSCFWALFAVLACNMLEISTSGGVWLQAQTLNMALMMWGIDCALRNRRVSSMILFALAVGYLPFSILMIPVALYYFYWQDRRNAPDHKPAVQVLRLWKPVLAAALIGAAYMWYNWIRFNNPLEFGHNYLPEFLNSEYGQFHIRYLWPNLRNILFRPVTLLPTGELNFPMFDGFMFYIANPFFIVWFVRLIQDIRYKRITGTLIALCIGFVVNLLFLCLHKTFAGWQFGARYTIDLIPYAFLFLLLSGKDRPRLWEQFLCAFGLLFNAYGMLIMRLHLGFS
jgi:hypothetical protein